MWNEVNPKMAGLLRYQIFLTYGIALAALWYAYLQNKSSVLSITNAFALGIPPSSFKILFDYAPFWCLCALAFYAVLSIGYGVATFENCPDAAEEVDRDVKEAKEELIKMGIKL